MSGLKLSTRQQGNAQLILSPASVTKLEPYPVGCEITKDSFSVTPRIPSRSIPKFFNGLKKRVLHVVEALIVIPCLEILTFFLF